MFKIMVVVFVFRECLWNRVGFEARSCVSTEGLSRPVAAFSVWDHLLHTSGLQAAKNVVRDIIYWQHKAHIVSTLNTFGISITSKTPSIGAYPKTILSSLAAFWSFCLSLARMISGRTWVGTAGTP